jgi:hypothetical protein
MDHALTTRTIITRTLHTARLLPAALAATEDTPLRSTPTDGGSRAVGSHSDPTPSAAARRRRTDERRTLDNLLGDLAETSRRLEQLVTKVTAPPVKIGACRTCVRTEQILTLPHLMCATCLKAADKARRRADPGTFDLDSWVTERHTALRNRAAKGQP